MGYLKSLLDWLVYMPPCPSNPITHEHFFVVNSYGKIPIALFYPQGDSEHTESLSYMIVSYGNSCDLSSMEDIYQKWADEFNCIIVGYDYLGYGMSVLNDQSLYRKEQSLTVSIEEVYYYLTELMGINCEKIIPMGFSMGTFPTLHLASQHKVGGTILISPFLSVMKAHYVTDFQYFLEDDFLKNYQIISQVKSPIFIIHGKADWNISISNSYQLITQISNLYTPLFPDNMGHTNWISDPIFKLIRDKIKLFIEHIFRPPMLLISEI